MLNESNERGSAKEAWCRPAAPGDDSYSTGCNLFFSLSLSLSLLDVHSRMDFCLSVRGVRQV